MLPGRRAADGARRVLHDVSVWGVSLFLVLVTAQNFFGSAVYSVVGPCMSEIWPMRLRACGMGLA